MIKHENLKLKEVYYEETLNNGLKIFLMPKNDFYKTYAIFATKYGSKDVEFVPLGKDEMIKTPEGIAHFLEHKLFENEDGTDVSNLFAKYGADANAFTTNDQTAYLFSTTSDFEKNLELLLDFVQNPFFKKEGILKEQGIIEQELLMYLDQPQNVQYFGILKALYKNHRIRNEIGGTVESIKEIDEDLLYTCYNTFYHPSNMVLAITGNFDLEKTIDFIKDNQSKKTFEQANSIKRNIFKEPLEINQKAIYVDMNINIPKIAIGLKVDPDTKNTDEFIKKAAAFEMLTDLYFNEASDNYEEMLELGIINNSFEYGSYFEHSYSHILFNLDTQNPEAFLDKMIQIIENIKDKTIKEDEFERIKKQYIARQIRHFNSIEYLANTLVETYFDEIDLFEELKIINSLNVDDLNNIRKYFTKEKIASFIIYPTKD